MKKQQTSLNVYGPLRVVVVYVLFTIFLHVFGPWRYKDEFLFDMLLYMTLALLMFIFGYHDEAKKWKDRLHKDIISFERNFKRFRRISQFGLSLQFLLVLVLFMVDYIAGRLTLESLLNPGQIYINALELNKDSSDISIVGQLKTLASPIFYLTNVYFAINYFRINSRWRYVFIFTLLFQLLYGALLKGAQKGFFDLFILFISVGVLGAFHDRLKFKRFMRYAVVFFFAVFVVFILFQVSRMTAYGASNYSGVERMRLDRSSLIFLLFGDSIGLGISLFILYLSQGYYGLSLSLQLPFEWTYGVGNSFALASYAEQYFGASKILEKTYPFRMDAVYDWPAQMYWHTFFPWVASDLTFFGSLLLMYAIGYSYAKSLIDGVIFGSPLGVCIFYFLTVLLLYLPANNQLMQTREMMIGFVALFLVWVFFGSRYRKSNNKYLNKYRYS